MNVRELKRWASETARSNHARFGSYGEYVFETVATTRYKRVAKHHRNEYDFRVGRRKVDVKTTASTIREKSSAQKCKPYVGRRLEGIDYARVELFSDCARISLEGRRWITIPWRKLVRLYDRWLAERKPGSRKEPSKKKTGASDKAAYASIKKRILAVAQKHGRKARIIQRTCQLRFGYSNPPHNVIANEHKFDLHVFVSFHDSRREPDNVERIFAFPNEAVSRLPRRKLDSLSKGVRKYDLSRVNKRFVFTTLKEFERKLGRVL